MADAEIRRIDKGYLFQILLAQHECSVPHELNKLISWVKAQMDADDVKLVQQEFDTWKKSL